ncbi:MAG: polysaccharide biosynthesis/export family protein, partial [Reyranella sp.]
MKYPAKGMRASNQTLGRVVIRRSILVGLAGATASCSGLAGSGPSGSEIDAASKSRQGETVRFALVDLSPDIVAVMEKWSRPSLQGGFGDTRRPAAQTIGVGDSIQVVIWEAAGGTLFSASGVDRQSPGGRSATIPEQIVAADGLVMVPFVGRIQAAGRSPNAVEQTIVAGLEGKAVAPQALVTVTKNVSNTVTVIGEVTSGARVPLTGRGDRILDVIASAGGIRVPAHEVFLMLVRQGQAVRVPMQAVLARPAENILVMPGDIVTVSRDPQTFTAAGATGQNAVIPFDAVGLSLDEAIARAGGLNDQRADPTGVFVVRFEEPHQYDELKLIRPTAGQTGQIPVIYRINMRDPNAFFLARRFSMRNKDLLFVSNAPLAELQKLFGVINTLIIPGA